MINIVICDDDPSFITSFSAQLSRVLDKLHVEFKLSALHKISNLYNELSEGMYYDIIFLDIEFFLEDKSGIDLSRYLRDNLRIDSTSIVFVSSKKSYAMSLFESQPLDFLVKPVDDEKLENTIKRFQRINNVLSKCFSFSHYGKEIKLPLSSIMYFQSADHKLIIHCAEGKTYEYSGKLSVVNDQLKENYFFSPHKSYLVNYYAVSGWGAADLTLYDNTIIPISRSHKENVQRIQFDREVLL